MALALDGVATAGIGTDTSVTAALTTSNTDDIIVATVYYRRSGNAPTVSGVSGGGLTWNKRAEHSAFDLQGCEVWWAHAASALAAEDITVTFTGSTSGASLVVFGVSGADTSVPFENHPSCPFHGGGDIRQNAIITTTVANTFIFSISGSDSSTTPSVGTGFTDIGSASGGISRARAQYQIASGIQDGLRVWTSAGTNSPGKLMIADAIREAGSGAGGGGRTLFLDGVHENEATNGLSLTAWLTAGNEDDLLCAMIHSERSNDTSPTVSGITDDDTLTWTKRADLTWVDGGSEGNRMELWTAQATGAIIDHSITASFTGSNFDDATMIVFAVAGAYAPDPFDGTGGTDQNNSSSTPAATLSTLTSDSLIIGALGLVVSASDVQDAGAGFTRFGDSFNGGGTRFSKLMMQMAYASSPQTGLSVAFNNTNVGWGVIADAFKSAPAPASGGTGPILMILG